MATEVAEVDVAIHDRASPSGQSSLNTTKRRRFRLKKNPEDQSRRPSGEFQALRHYFFLSTLFLM